MQNGEGVAVVCRVCAMQNRACAACMRSPALLASPNGSPMPFPTQPHLAGRNGGGCPVVAQHQPITVPDVWIWPRRRPRNWVSTVTPMWGRASWSGLVGVPPALAGGDDLRHEHAEHGRRLERRAARADADIVVGHVGAIDDGIPVAHGDVVEVSHPAAGGPASPAGNASSAADTGARDRSG